MAVLHNLSLTLSNLRDHLLLLLNTTQAFATPFRILVVHNDHETLGREVNHRESQGYSEAGEVCTHPLNLCGLRSLERAVISNMFSRSFSENWISTNSSQRLSQGGLVMVHSGALLRIFV